MERKRPKTTEKVAVYESCGRVTAEAVYAAICAPHYAASAMDGIAVIVSNDNAMNCLSSEEVRDIYMGEITDWSEVNE